MLTRLCERRVFVLCLCLAATYAAYFPAIGGGYIWDDFYLVGENPFFRSPVFGLEVFRHWLFFDSFSTYYRPIQNWSYILDYWLWRENTAGYHLTNIALHAGAGFLLYLLARKLLPAILTRDGQVPEKKVAILSVLVVLVWLVHPVHNAAVAYISGRADSLAALFALSAWLLALRAFEAPWTWRRLASAMAAPVMMLAALCSKEIALVWLGLFLVHQWWKGTRGLRGKVVTTGAALAVLALYFCLHSLPAYRAPMEDGPPAPLEARTLLMFRALGDYTSLMIFPDKLRMERSLSNFGVANKGMAMRGEWLSLIGFLTALVAVQACRWRVPGRDLRVAGVAWFAIAFLPISNLFPLNAEVAEHWIYLASIGFIMAAAGVVVALPARARRWASAAGLLAIGALTIRTAVRSADWTDAETFCRRTIEAGGASPRILNTLASIYGRREDWAKQEIVLRRTLEHFPDFTPARIQLGMCLAKQGRAPEAAGLLRLAAAEADESARRFPRTWPAALNLAKLRLADGDADGARMILADAQARFPEVWEIVRPRSELVRDADGAAAALPVVEHFAAEHWWHLEAWLAVGRFSSAAGDADGAIAAFHHASRLDLYDGRSLACIAGVEFSRRHTDAALAAQAEAIARDPERPAHYFELGSLLAQLGRKAEATGALRKAQLLAAKPAPL